MGIEWNVHGIGTVKILSCNIGVLSLYSNNNKDSKKRWIQRFDHGIDLVRCTTNSHCTFVAIRRLMLLQSMGTSTDRIYSMGLYLDNYDNRANDVRETIRELEHGCLMLRGRTNSSKRHDTRIALVWYVK